MIESSGPFSQTSSGPAAALPIEHQISALLMDAQVNEERLEKLRKFRETKQAKELVDFIHNAYKKCKTARTLQEQQWLMNLAMYSGKHDTEMWRGTTPHTRGKLYVPTGKRRNKIINRLKPVIRTELARLMSQKPSASVIPASSDDEDLFAAIAGEQVFNRISDRRKMQWHFSRAAFWTVICGTGFLKTTWDPTLLDKDSEQEGDVRYESVTPFNIFVPDLREEDLEEQPYVLHMYTKSRAALQRLYADELEGVKIEPSAVQADDLLADAYLNISSSRQSTPDSCMVYELWVKPGGTELLPNGGLVILVDKTIVWYEDSGLPYAHGEYPFSKYEHIPTGTFYAESIIVDLTALIKEYNKIRSQISEAADKMGKPQLLAPKGSVMPTKITNQVAQVIEYRPGMAPPSPLALQELPGYIVAQQDRVLMDIEDVSGQHQVSRGNVPPGVTAATAISVLQEKDDSLLTHTYQSIEHGMEKVARQTLALVVQYWDIPRVVKVAGEDSFFDVLMLVGADLRRGTDVKIEPGSALPQSKAGKQAFILDLMNAGHIPSEEGLKTLEMGGANKIVEQLRYDERQAQRENIKMKNVSAEQVQQKRMELQMLEMQGIYADDMGNPLTDLIVPVNEFDNHEVHIEIHNRYRKSQAYELLPPEAKQQFDAHVQMHKQMLAFSQLEEMLMMIPTDGTIQDSAGGMVNAAAEQSFNEAGIPDDTMMSEDELTDVPEPIPNEGV